MWKTWKVRLQLPVAHRCMCTCAHQSVSSSAEPTLFFEARVCHYTWGSPIGWAVTSYTPISAFLVLFQVCTITPPRSLCRGSDPCAWVSNADWGISLVPWLDLELIILETYIWWYPWKHFQKALAEEERPALNVPKAIYILILQVERLGLSWAFETSQPTSSDTLHPTRPNLLQ